MRCLIKGTPGATSPCAMSATVTSRECLTRSAWPHLPETEGYLTTSNSVRSLLSYSGDCPVRDWTFYAMTAPTICTISHLTSGHTYVLSAVRFIKPPYPARCRRCRRHSQIGGRCSLSLT